MTDVEIDDEVIRKSFRAAMGNVAAAVSVVTTLDEGEPHGTTVSAFSSLSMDPPMLLVSLDNTSALLARLHIGSAVGVNVLASHQDQIALRFATKGRDRFADIPWHLEAGAPALDDLHGWVAVSVTQLVEAGDHTVVIGRVEDADACVGAPAFGTHAPF